MNEHTELRAGVIAAYGEGKQLSQLDALIAQNERLLTLERSVLKKAEMLRSGWWDLSEEAGAAGEIHQAITDFWIELENEVKAREALEEKMASESRPCRFSCS